VVCKAQYGDQDADPARRNYRTTISSMARLAAQADVENLALFRLSERYASDEWRDMLSWCSTVLPATSFPKHWEQIG
jgi:ribonuclease BN (tRNA processing enzyme)